MLKVKNVAYFIWWILWAVASGHPAVMFFGFDTQVPEQKLMSAVYMIIFAVVVRLVLKWADSTQQHLLDDYNESLEECKRMPGWPYTNKYRAEVNYAHYDEVVEYSVDMTHPREDLLACETPIPVRRLWWYDEALQSHATLTRIAWVLGFVLPAFVALCMSYMPG